MSIESITAEGLRKLIADQQEHEYRVVDVREPSEFTQGHIPGALSLPLSRLARDLSPLAGNRDLVFYCHSGGRSAVAALMVKEEEVSKGQLYNLEGGMVVWDGGQVTGVAAVDVFAAADHPTDLMQIAINLEKGALRFYEAAIALLPGSPFASTFRQLAAAEVAHAKLVYNHWKEMAHLDESFEAIFENMSGDIMEGGKALEDVLAAVGDTPESAMRLVEMALSIEYAAYDLYRTMGDQSTVPSDSRVAFISLAQLEKAHLSALVNALAEHTEA